MMKIENRSEGPIAVFTGPSDLFALAVACETVVDLRPASDRNRLRIMSRAALESEIGSTQRLVLRGKDIVDLAMNALGTWQNMDLQELDQDVIYGDLQRYVRGALPAAVPSS